MTNNCVLSDSAVGPKHPHDEVLCIARKLAEKHGRENGLAVGTSAGARVQAGWFRNEDTGAMTPAFIVGRIGRD